MIDDPFIPVARLTDVELLTRVRELARGEAHWTAALVAHLAELDARRLYLDEGYASLYAYCRASLKLSEHAAYDRIAAARVGRRFPVVLRMLAAGAIHLAALALLGRHLNTQNHRWLLRWASGRPKREIERMAACLAGGAPTLEAGQPGSMAVCSATPAGDGADPIPASAPPSAWPAGPDVRPAPGRPRVRVRTVSGQPVKRPRGRPRLTPSLHASTELTLFGPDSAVPEGKALSTPPRGMDAPPPSAPAAALPARPDQPPVIIEYRLSVSLTPEEWDALEQARRLVHAHLHEGDLGRVVGLVLREFVAIRGGNRGRVVRQTSTRDGRLSRDQASERPDQGASREPPLPESATIPPRPSHRYIPVAVRRAVWERDAGQCAFHAATGRRCAEVERLEFHHRLPFRAGGLATPGNLELRCRAHNRMEETGAPSAWRGRAGPDGAGRRGIAGAARPLD